MSSIVCSNTMFGLEGGPNLCKSPQDYQAFRIHRDERHRLAISFDPLNAPTDLISCIEIFDRDGTTPIHRHQRATELFFILQGQGKVDLDGVTRMVQTGDSILIPPNRWHRLANAGRDRLYVLCVMSPNEGFAELIRNGVPAPIDPQDLAVLERANCTL